MSNNIDEYTFTSYLGHEFQQRLLWQLLVEPEFAEKSLPNLSTEYFDDPNIRKLFIFIKQFFKEYEKVPNLQNQSIHQCINKYKNPKDIIEEETLFSVLKRIELWNERVINKEQLHDGDIIQKATNEFIKQQEYRKLGEFILLNTKNGSIRNKDIIGVIEERIRKITSIGEDEDNGTEVIENVDHALRKEFRETIPTGIAVLDAVTGGGLGKSEIGIILAPPGTGKTTLLTKIANTAYEDEKNVLQIIFEDTADQIKRKHYTIWSDVPLSQIDDNREHVKTIVKEKIKKLSGKGKLVIKRFSQEDTTMIDIRNWIIRYQKKFGFKFDLVVLDYLDCLESHKKTSSNTEDELVIVKSFESFAADFNIPAWTAIQSNRSGIGSEYVEAYQSGGSIKRVQKAHFFMSISKTKEQQEANLGNVRIIKARFAKDGQTFDDCIFNNDTMEIRIEDDRYGGIKFNKLQKKHDEKDINNIENSLNNLKNEEINDLNINNTGIQNKCDIDMSEFLNDSENIEINFDELEDENNEVNKMLNEKRNDQNDILKKE